MVTASLLLAQCLFFTPPSGWNIVGQKAHNEAIKMSFVEPKANYPSSMTLAVDETSISLKQYIASVKKLYTLKRDKHLSDLGPIELKIGKGHLLEIDHETSHGLFRQLQILVPLEGKIVILTSASLARDFLNQKDLIINAFRTLTLADKITDTLTPEEKKQDQEMRLKLSQEKKDEKEILEKYHAFLHNHFHTRGPYWELLMLQDYQEAVKK